MLNHEKIDAGSTPLKRPLNPGELIGYIFPPRLGDTLIGMIIVNNLIRNGFQVEAYGDFLYSLRDWFPQLKIYPLPPLSEDGKLAKYSTVICMCKDYGYAEQLDKWHKNSLYLWHEPLYGASISMVDIQMIQCQEHLGLKNIVRENGTTPPKNLIHHKYKNRVMIHPTSSEPFKNWPAKKFIKLAAILKTKDYDPYFILPENERAEWKKIVPDQKMIPSFASLSDVAAWIYESRYFIGNDSGIGHLASCLGIPTLSIVIRKGTARLWGPAWSPHVVVRSPAWLITRQLKEKFWKRVVSVAKVVHEFKELEKW